MALDVSMELRKQNISALMAQMQRNANLFGRGLPNSVKWGAWFVADALRTATKIAPKKRKAKKLPRREMDKWHKSRPGWNLYEIERWHKGRKSTVQVYARGKRELNKSSKVEIRRRGLAARAWHFAQAKLGSGRGGPRVDAAAERLAARHGTVTMHLTGVNPSITLSNRLDYAADAFKGQGEQTIGNVMDRAARQMTRRIDAKLAKAMKAK